MNIRAAAAEIITQVLKEKLPLSQILPKYKSKCKPEDAGFLQALCYGVFRYYPRYQFLANKILAKPLKQKDSILMNLLCVGLYQIIEMRIPNHAAISETVEAARALHRKFATGLINANLRSYLRQSELLNQALSLDEVALSAHPAWLLENIKLNYPEHFQAIIEANNTAAPMMLRVNFRQESREGYLTLLQKAGIAASPLAYLSTGIKLETACDVQLLPRFKQGLVSVQDSASQLIPTLLDLAPGLSILDACSAPGGKLCHLLETVDLDITAIDVSLEKTSLIHDNLTRLKLNAKVLTADVTEPNKWWDGKLFDRILCDVPCSAVGVIRRHPDIKLLRDADNIEHLAKQQLKILSAVFPLLKENGILLYTTCSILPEENQLVIEKFLKQTPSASLLPINIPVGIAQTVGHQILPGQAEMDGFYYAKIVKR